PRQQLGSPERSAARLVEPAPCVGEGPAGGALPAMLPLDQTPRGETGLPAAAHGERTEPLLGDACVLVVADHVLHLLGALDELRAAPPGRCCAPTRAWPEAGGRRGHRLLRVRPPRRPGARAGRRGRGPGRAARRARPARAAAAPPTRRRRARAPHATGPASAW